ncbi:MAG: hypothetical protein EPN26_10465 [Rhodospirillales bacterium]|nr:MAG: hypothetical protein EPN26_10465 [Rhodospirillales bacterium]
MDDIKKIPSRKSDLRKFGVTVGAVLLAFGVLSAWRNNGLQYWFSVPAVALVFGGLAAPGALLPLQKVWMTLALLMGFVMTRVILTLLYYLVVTPTGLLMRILGKDFVQRKFDRPSASYWIVRPPTALTTHDYERQF